MLQIQLAKKKDFIRIIKECLSETRGKVILFWKHKAEENDGEKEILLLVPIFYPGVGEWILWCYTQSLGDKGPEGIISELA
ncbi:MAG TPA: hypothetical protein EYP68_03400, partial [Candidatus Korarchaeota archaeon]|nr:hypothetical protein [Candidatus Korarchaeota archaeon]